MSQWSLLFGSLSLAMGCATMYANSDLIRRSDVIAMRPERKAETYKKYCIDVVAC